MSEFKHLVYPKLSTFFYSRDDFAESGELPKPDHTYSSFLKSLINTIDNIDKDELGKGAKEIISNMRKDIGNELENVQEIEIIEDEISKSEEELRKLILKREVEVINKKKKAEIQRLKLLEEICRFDDEIDEIKNIIDEECNNPGIKC